MKISDLEKFTVDELEQFEIQELGLENKELLDKLRYDNRPLPLAAIEKIQALCNDLPVEYFPLEKVKSRNDVYDLTIKRLKIAHLATSITKNVIDTIITVIKLVSILHP